MAPKGEPGLWLRNPGLDLRPDICIGLSLGPEGGLQQTVATELNCRYKISSIDTLCTSLPAHAYLAISVQR